MAKDKKTKVTSGKKSQRGGKKYQRDTRCSVGPGEKRSVAPSTHTPGKQWIAITGAIKPRFERKGAPAGSRPRVSTTSSDLQRSMEKRDKTEAPKTASQKWCDEVLNAGLRNLRKNFVEVVKPYVAEGARSAFNDDANADKNRYDDVELLDKTRVKITTNAEDDYIHASFVEISPQMRLICTQGPLENTVHQFWIMVVEQSSKVVLQLCQNAEDGKEKCADYLPQKDGGELEFGPVKVKVVGANMNVGAMKKVTRTLIEVSYGDKILETTHLLYAGWPDHTVPDSLQTYMELRTLILRLYNKSPIVTHCSAGVGRTGSYAAIELAIYQLTVKNDKEFSMVDTMRKLRNQRMHSVQNDQQYAFIHRMVLEILVNDSLIEKNSRLQKFFKEYNDLIERKRAELEKAREKAANSKKSQK